MSPGCGKKSRIDEARQVAKIAGALSAPWRLVVPLV
jgi:hypothetical protein